MALWARKLFGPSRDGPQILDTVTEKISQPVALDN